LQAASKVSANADEWRTDTGSGVLTLKPFASIQEEQYRLYNATES
jgi:hypothetical protein